MALPIPISPSEVRAIAAAARVEPRTVHARLSGRRMLATTAAAVDRALRQLGYPEAPAAAHERGELATCPHCGSAVPVRSR